jgi:GNAT superfamily N-acetyltransferase
VKLLLDNFGKPITDVVAADICFAAAQLSTLVPPEHIAMLPREYRKDAVFGVERMEDIAAEVKPLHLEHWRETEVHRHGLTFNMDYETLIRYEQAGRFVLFTLRSGGGMLVGNCGMYLDRSVHTQTLIATEDTLYLLPEARRGRTAVMFVKYVEDSLRKLGVKEIDITVKTVNKAARFFTMLGYKHVENGLTKVLEAENVQQETA